MYNPQAYRKFENPNGLVADGIKARNIYYDSIGLSYQPVGRGTMYSQPRQAFGVALSKRIGYALTAKVLEKDRTTLNHYGKCHEVNLESWDGYAQVYDNAKYVVDTLFDGSTKTYSIYLINGKVS